MPVRGGGVAAQAVPPTVYYPTSGATPTREVAHDFLQGTVTGNLGNSLLRINRDGCAAFGLGSSKNPWDVLSRFNIGKGINSLTVDDLTGPLGISQGVTCLGFNAARQQIDGNFYLGSDDTNNGGALVWADTRAGLSFSTIGSGTGINGSGGPQTARYLNKSWVMDYQRLKIHPNGQVQIGAALSGTSPHPTSPITSSRWRASCWPSRCT